MFSFTINALSEEKQVEGRSPFYVEITDTEYKGTKFTLGQLEFTGEDEEGNAHVKFDYDILEMPENLNKEENREQLENIIGNILHTLLEQTLIEEQNSDEDNRNDNSTESNI